MRPFFRDHFARLDRQVVLVDALAAFNSGPNALFDLEAALAGILDCFQDWPRQLPQRAVPAEDRPHSVSQRPRPITCIIRATTGWKPCCGVLSRTP